MAKFVHPDEADVARSTFVVTENEGFCLEVADQAVKVVANELLRSQTFHGVGDGGFDGLETYRYDSNTYGCDTGYSENLPADGYPVGKACQPIIHQPPGERRSN